MRLLSTGRVASCALACLFAADAVAQSPAPAPQAKVETGALAGSVADGVIAYKGIPFAAPPVGPLRWRPPQPAAPWSGVRQATQYGHDCMQQPFPSDAAPLGTPPAEDCLALNVWRPASAKTKLPVMVWLYGGGFVNGGSSPAVYSGASFAKQGVVMVSPNYRVGRFGFFGFPALTAEHPGEPKGNYGYMDQIAALKWVRRNIAAFGGDPDNVTVFGESAGGGSVHMLLTSPLARGLFNKAIIESGGGRSTLTGDRMLSQSAPNRPSLEEIGANFARYKGIEGTDAAALVKLRALSAEAVTDGLNMASGSTRNGAPTYGGPILDGKIVVADPDAVYKAGKQAKVPLMIGANSADIGFSAARTIDDVFAPFGARRAQAMQAYGATAASDPRAIGAAVGMDKGMVEPARFVAATFAAQGLPAYEYRFSYVADSMESQWKTGAPHATEIPYVFDTVGVKYGPALTAKDQQVARAANSYWVNFAKTGDPNGGGLPHWARYSAAGDQIMDFRADGVVASAPDLWKARLDVAAANAAP
jgi:para-nitrobenzyl esterase